MKLIEIIKIYIKTPKKNKLKTLASGTFLRILKSFIRSLEVPVLLVKYASLKFI